MQVSAFIVDNLEDQTSPSRFHRSSSPSVELWLANLDTLSNLLEKLSLDYPLLTNEDCIEFIGSEEIPRLRMRRTARMVLRFLLTRFFGSSLALKKFEIGSFGKPTIPGLTGDFNLAHAGGFALIGLGEVPTIGVDIEQVREVRLSPSRRSALIDAALEVSRGKPLPEMEDFRTVQAWTRLEALAKAEGKGIGRILARYGIWGSHRETRFASRIKDSFLMVHDLPVSHINMLAAVCLPHGINLPRIRILPIQFEELLSVLLRKGEPSIKSGVDLNSVAMQNSLLRSVAQPG